MVVDSEEIVLTRTDDGVRAFHNVCQHRGHPLLAASGRCDQIVCPLHGWRYALDGALEHVPDEAAFPNLDRTALRLSELPCRVRAGGIEVQRT